MSAVIRLFGEWFEEEFPDGIGNGSRGGFHQDDVQDAFVEGWSRAMSSTWDPGGRLAHPRAPRGQVQDEHGLLMGGGGFFIRSTDPEVERIYPTEKWTADQKFSGGHVYVRRIILVDEWVELT